MDEGRRYHAPRLSSSDVSGSCEGFNSSSSVRHTNATWKRTSSLPTIANDPEQLRCVIIAASIASDTNREVSDKLREMQDHDRRSSCPHVIMRDTMRKYSIAEELEVIDMASELLFGS